MKIIKKWVEQALRQLGWQLRRLSSEDKLYLNQSYDDSVPLPKGAESALSLDSPRLKELQRDYGSLGWPVCAHSLWDPEMLRNDLAPVWFRGDNAYVWQLRQMPGAVRFKQYLAYRYVCEKDQMGLFNRLEEDGLFGCWGFRYAGGAKISRDLVESVNEVNFLDKHCELSKVDGLRVLDIGAGYGRLAYRMCEALPNLKSYHCIDAVPESTFLSEYYLRFREVDDRAQVFPLTDVDQLGRDGEYELAVNVHSFSECTFVAVEWWLQRVRLLKIPYLLIVPNDPEVLMTTEIDGPPKDFSSLVEAAGYRLKVKEPVYNDAEIRELIGIQDHFFLYERVVD